MDENKVEDFDVVIFDIDPTVHTLLLLALPKFLDGLLGKLINLHMKLSGVDITLHTSLGDTSAQEWTQTIDNNLDRLDQFIIKKKHGRSLA